MAFASDGTTMHSSGGPVTRAIAAVRDDSYGEAIERMLSRDAASQQALSALSINGLCSLFQAHDAASLAFAHEANTPRAGDDDLSSQILDEIADHHHRGQEAVIAEMERRRPSGSSDRAMRFKLLGAWYVGCEDWAAVARLANEIGATTQFDARGP